MEIYTSLSYMLTYYIGQTLSLTSGTSSNILKELHLGSSLIVHWDIDAGDTGESFVL